MTDPCGWHSRGYLPHYDDGTAMQVIGYRLSDALPAVVLGKLEEQSLEDEKRREAIEQLLGTGHGCCALRRPSCANTVIENWRHFDGARYRLHAWAVMPNHVHVLIEPLARAKLKEIVQSWKSYSAKIILQDFPPGNFAGNHVWQPDYYDRYIRNAEHYLATLEYIHQNPVKAGLVARASDWPWSSAIEWERGRLGRQTGG